MDHFAINIEANEFEDFVPDFDDYEQGWHYGVIRDFEELVNEKGVQSVIRDMDPEVVEAFRQYFKEQED